MIRRRGAMAQHYSQREIRLTLTSSWATPRIGRRAAKDAVSGQSNRAGREAVAAIVYSQAIYAHRLRYRPPTSITAGHRLRFATLRYSRGAGLLS